MVCDCPNLVSKQLQLFADMNGLRQGADKKCFSLVLV